MRSRMLSISAAAFGTCVLLGGGHCISSLAYTGSWRPSSGFWLMVLAALGSGVVVVSALVRDQIVERQERIMAQLEDIELRILDYGDQREAGGHATATRVTKTQTGRPIRPVN